LSSAFNGVSTGLTILATFAFLWMLKEEDRRTTENEIGGRIEQSCIDSATRKPTGNPDAAPTEKQQVMTALVARMDETDIGRRMNESAARHRLIWCAGTSNDYYGAYSGRIAILSTPHFGGSQTILADQRQMNRALRTMYEENAHAWQDNEQRSISASFSSIPHHKIGWTLAVESSARVTAFTALNQHYLAGDKAVWHDNIADRKNTIIMARMANAAHADGTFGPDSFRAGFDAFYDMPSLVTNYQVSAGDSYILFFGKNAESDKYVARLGTVPGIEGNYLSGHFSLDTPRYSGILNPALHERLRNHYNNNNIDTRPLTRNPANEVNAPKTTRLSPH
jgi:hypothetical protein